MNLIDEIKKHEGFKSTVYKCTEGYDTIGYGFAIKDLEIDEEIAELILSRKLGNLQLRICNTFDWYIESPQKVQDVIMNMSYQMGITGVGKFKNMIKHFKAKNWKEASKEMLNSLWARQTPNRAKELARIVANYG